MPSDDAPVPSRVAYPPRFWAQAGILFGSLVVTVVGLIAAASLYLRNPLDRTVAGVRVTAGRAENTFCAYVWIRKVDDPPPSPALGTGPKDAGCGLDGSLGVRGTTLRTGVGNGGKAVWVAVILTGPDVRSLSVRLEAGREVEVRPYRGVALVVELDRPLSYRALDAHRTTVCEGLLRPQGAVMTSPPSGSSTLSASRPC